MMRYLAVVASICWALGCAPAMDDIARHLDRGAFADALRATDGDPERQTELAAAIVERAVRAGTRPSDLVAALGSDGAAGRRALARLAENGTDATALLAELALAGRTPPRGAALERFLTDGSGSVRAKAAQMWNTRLEPDRLLRLLLDTDPRVRAAAAAGLVRFAAEPDVETALCQALRLDPEPQVRASIARQGAIFRDGALLLLKDALHDESLGVRLAALGGLASIGDPTGRIIVGEIANGPLEEMAVAAAAELARLGDPQGRDRLADALADRRPGIRAAAFLALERARSADRRAIASKLLADEAPEIVLLAAASLRDDEGARQEVLAALARIAADRGARALEARDLAAGLGDAESLAALVRSFAEGGEPEIVPSLARIHGFSAVRGAVVPLLADTRDAVRLTAALALLSIRPE